MKPLPKPSLLNPSMAEAHMNWGMVLQITNDLDAAEARFEQAILADERHIPSYSKLGTLLAKRSKFARAEEIYARVVELLPRDPSARINRALALIKLKRKDEAKASLEACLRLDPNNALARKYLSSWRNSLRNSLGFLKRMVHGARHEPISSFPTRSWFGRACRELG